MAPLRIGSPRSGRSHGSPSPAGSAARAALAVGPALGRRDLLADDSLRERRDLALQESCHPLLVPADVASELRRVLVADRLAEDLDRRVRGNLLVLVEVLGLGV